MGVFGLGTLPFYILLDCWISIKFLLHPSIFPLQGRYLFLILPLHPLDLFVIFLLQHLNLPPHLHYQHHWIRLASLNTSLHILLFPVIFLVVTMWTLGKVSSQPHGGRQILQGRVPLRVTHSVFVFRSSRPPGAVISDLFFLYPR